MRANARNVTFTKSSRWLIYTINSVDKNKLSWFNTVIRSLFFRPLTARDQKQEEAVINISEIKRTVFHIQKSKSWQSWLPNTFSEPSCVK